jgi:lipid kinase YegS
MPSAGPRRIRIIANERAAHSDDLRSAIQGVRDQGLQVEVRVIWEKGQGIPLAEEGVQLGFPTLVAAGGDGTINEVINGIYRAKPSYHLDFGIIPFGTANDFAVGVGLTPRDATGALKLIAEGQPKEIDIGKVNDRLFINAASGGVGARFTATAPKPLKHAFGGFAYFLTGLANPGLLEPIAVRVRGEGLDWSGDIIAFTIGNGRQTGGGFPVCPKALFDDGLLDLFLIPNVPPAKHLVLGQDLLNLGKVETYQLIQYFQSPWFEIEAQRPMHYNLDGEPFVEKSLRVDLMDQRRPVYLPDAAPLRS